MKLRRKDKDLQPKQYKFTLSGDKAQLLEHYRQYYESNYQEKIELEELIPAIIAHFIPSDREFNRWYRNQNFQEAKSLSEKIWLDD